MFLFFISIFTIISFLPKSTSAAGVFEVDDIKDSYSAIVGQDFIATISFFYSGSEYKPKVVLVSRNFPPGLKIGAVNTLGTSFYNVQYEGVPEAIGDYSLTFSFTDDYGAMVNKKVSIKIIGLVFNNISNLPRAIVNTPYSYDIYYDYPQIFGETPRITYYNIPEGLDLSESFKQPNAVTNFFHLRLTAKKSGIYTFLAKVYWGKVLLAYDIPLTIIVDDVTTVQENNQQPVVNIVPVNVPKPIIVPTKTKKQTTEKIVSATTTSAITTVTIDAVSSSTTNSLTEPTTDKKIITKTEKWYTKLWKFIWKL